MKTYLKIVISLSVIALYSFGTNQTILADTAANMESQASIHFDQSYFPPEVDPVIPSGSTPSPVYTGNRSLPKTGEKSSIEWPMFGGVILGLDLLLIAKQKNKKQTKEN